MIINELTSLTKIQPPLDLSKMAKSTLLTCFAELISMLQSEGEMLARAQALEYGKPIRYCRGEIDRCIFLLEHAMAWLEARGHVPSGERFTERSFSGWVERRRFPLGIVLGITTFSSPYSSFFQKFLPCLAAGNVFVFKPSPKVHDCSRQLFDRVAMVVGPLFSGALHGLFITDVEAAQIFSIRTFDAIMFTGKSETAHLIKTQIGRTPGVFETGSNALAFVDEGVDPDAVSKTLVHSAFDQSGMRCIGLKNLFVNRRHAQSFIDHLVLATTSCRSGDPLDEKVVVGPVRDSTALAGLLGTIAELKRNGYRVLTGGEAKGDLLLPTILLDRENAFPSVREAYGPVLCVHIVDSCADIDPVYWRRSSIQASIYSPREEVVNLFFAHCRDTAAICANYGPALRMDGLPFGGFHDENEGKEGFPGLFDMLTREQLIIKKEGEKK